jgi:hypothetical protein
VHKADLAIALLLDFMKGVFQRSCSFLIYRFFDDAMEGRSIANAAILPVELT